MKKKELRILGLSYSQTQIGSYVIVLSDISGNRKLPIVIKPTDAQRIAIEIENIKPTRPMVHDLFKSLTDFYNIDVIEVFIHSLVEGIFYTNITTTDGLNEVNIECAAGDALALSVIYKCPIYTTSEILNSAGITINDDGTPMTDEELAEFDELDKLESDIYNNKTISIQDLEQMMKEAIQDEDYEMAAELRDKIEDRKRNEQ